MTQKISPKESVVLALAELIVLALHLHHTEKLRNWYPVNLNVDFDLENVSHNRFTLTFSMKSSFIGVVFTVYINILGQYAADECSLLNSRTNIAHSTKRNSVLVNGTKQRWNSVETALAANGPDFGRATEVEQAGR